MSGIEQCVVVHPNQLSSCHTIVSPMRMSVHGPGLEIINAQRITRQD